MTLCTATNRIETDNRIYCVQEIGGRRSPDNSSSKMFMAAMEISHHSIGSILVQDEEVTLLQSLRLEF
jgi:hypothetical protein